MTMNRDILLFGGTFDPVHCGHVAVARALAVDRDFGRVIFVPAATPPHKPDALARAADRVAMLRCVCDEDSLFDISDIELARPGRSYTYDTLLALRGEYGHDARLHWLIGADMLADLHKWYRAADLVEMVDFVIAMRPPWHERMDKIFATLAEHFSNTVISQLRGAVVDTPLVDVSSTEIRQRVAAGESIAGMVPAGVADYIAANGLYR